MGKGCPNCGPGSLIRLVERIFITDYDSDDAGTVHYGQFWYCPLCQAVASFWAA